MSKWAGKKFYVATSLANRGEMLRVAENLKKLGMVHSFCWDAVPFAQWPQQAQLETNAILESEIFVALLPGKLGTVTEVGIALGAKIATPSRRVILHAKDPELFTKTDFENGIYPAVFWLHPDVERIHGADPVTAVRNQLLNAR